MLLKKDIPKFKTISELFNYKHNVLDKDKKYQVKGYHHYFRNNTLIINGEKIEVLQHTYKSKRMITVDWFKHSVTILEVGHLRYAILITRWLEYNWKTEAVENINKIPTIDEISDIIKHVF